VCVDVECVARTMVEVLSLTDCIEDCDVCLHVSFGGLHVGGVQ
jgi:hypothetical protein